MRREQNCTFFSRVHSFAAKQNKNLLAIATLIQKAIRSKLSDWAHNLSLVHGKVAFWRVDVETQRSQKKKQFEFIVFWQFQQRWSCRPHNQSSPEWTNQAIWRWWYVRLSCVIGSGVRSHLGVTFVGASVNHANKKIDETYLLVLQRCEEWGWQEIFAWWFNNRSLRQM